MIGYIKGALLQTWKNSCLILTNSGLGYNIALCAHTFAMLPAQGEDVEFYISQVIREDSHDLYGFSTFEERQTFDVLIGISKVGSRTALAILSLYRPDELWRIAQDADIRSLTRVPGIGQKTAQHILLELKYKLAKISTQPSETKIKTSTFTDVIEAMANLGYDEEECGQEIRNIIEKEPDIDVGSAIRLTLKALAKRKT